MPQAGGGGAPQASAGGGAAGGNGGPVASTTSIARVCRFVILHTTTVARMPTAIVTPSSAIP